MGRSRDAVQGTAGTNYLLKVSNSPGQIGVLSFPYKMNTVLVFRSRTLLQGYPTTTAITRSTMTLKKRLL